MITDATYHDSRYSGRHSKQELPNTSQKRYSDFLGYILKSNVFLSFFICLVNKLECEVLHFGICSYILGSVATFLDL
jgi:hypothetical protein